MWNGRGFMKRGECKTVARIGKKADIPMIMMEGCCPHCRKRFFFGLKPLELLIDACKKGGFTKGKK